MLENILENVGSNQRRRVGSIYPTSQDNASKDIWQALVSPDFIIYFYHWN
jgi:hypothetical protein